MSIAVSKVLASRSQGNFPRPNQMQQQGGFSPQQSFSPFPAAMTNNQPQFRSVPRTGDSLYQRMFGDVEQGIHTIVFLFAIGIICSWIYDKLKQMGYIKKADVNKSKTPNRSKKQTPPASIPRLNSPKKKNNNNKNNNDSHHKKKN